jgi:hypothetical protein
MAFEAEVARLFCPGGPTLLLLPSPWLAVSGLSITVSFAWVLRYYLWLICIPSPESQKRQGRIGFFRLFLKVKQNAGRH